MELCMESERSPRSRVANRWWEKYRLELEGMWTADQDMKQTEGGKEMHRTETY